MDDFDEYVLGARPTLSHLSARRETNDLMTALRLPVDETGRSRAERRRDVLARLDQRIKLPDIFAH